jgi:hypothetical protein
MKIKDLKRPEKPKESHGVIGRGPRGGYGVPIKKRKKTKYDGENLMHTLVDPGSNTQ